MTTAKDLFGNLVRDMREGKTKTIACACKRGVVEVLGSWPEPCPVCEGRGEMTFSELGRLLDEWPRTLERAADLRSRAKTASRIFEGLSKVFERLSGSDSK